MCGRYYVEPDTLEKIRRVVHDVEQEMRPAALAEEQGNWSRKDICPGMPAPLFRLPREDGTDHETAVRGKAAHAGDPALAEAVWGLTPPSGKGLVINARAETVWDKPMFRSGIRKGRAAVPAAGFYEWNPAKERFRFHRDDSQLLLLAAFVEPGEKEDRFVILTTAANDSVSPVHPRMPVILEPDALVPWLTDPAAAEEILRAVPIRLAEETEYEQLSFL